MWLIAISLFFLCRLNSFVRSLQFKNKQAAAHLNQCSLFESMMHATACSLNNINIKNHTFFFRASLLKWQFILSVTDFFFFVSYILISLHHLCFPHQMFKVRCCDLGTLCPQTQMCITHCSLYRLWTLGSSKIHLIDKTLTFPSEAQRSGVVSEGRISEAQRRFDIWSRCL